MASKLSNLVKSLEQQDSAGRISTYQLIEKLIQKSSIQITNESCKSLCDCVLSDLKSNKECLSSILSIVEQFFKQDTIKNIRLFSNVYQENEFLSSLVDILGANENKDLIEKIYSIFVVQNFDTDTMELFIESIFTSCVVHDSSVDLLLVKVISRFLEQCPNEMLIHINLWFNILLELTCHSNSKVREHSSDVIKFNIKIFLQNRSKILTQCSKTLRKKVLPALQLMTAKSSVLEEVLTTQLPLFFAIIGEEFIRSSSFTNLHLSIIQKGFTAKNEIIPIHAFSTWGHFINALSENKEILSSPKYTKLILQPLKMKLKTVVLTKTCIQTMWMLSVYLKGKIVELYDEVCLPLLRLCFSCLASSASRRLSKQLSTQDLNQSPIKDPVLHLLGTEILFHLLCDTSKIDFKYVLPKLDEPYIGSPSSFSRYQSSVVPILTTVFKYPPEGISFDFLMELWKVFLKCSEDQVKKKRDSELFKSLFQLADQIVTSSIYPPTYLLKLITSLTCFPSKILNSSLNFSPGSFNGTPALSLIQLLFNHSIYDHVKDTNEYFQCLKKVIMCGMESKLATLDFAYSVVKHLGKENIVDLKTWLCLATLLDDYVSKTKDVNQGDSLDHDFTSLYTILLFPVQFFISYISPLRESTVKEVTSTWVELMTNFAFLSSQVETTTYEEAKMSTANQIIEKLNDLENKNIHNKNCIPFFESVLETLVENVEFKQIEKRKSVKRRSVELLEVKENLNGFNFALTQLIVCLHKVKVEEVKYQINVTSAISEIFLNLPHSLVQGFFLELLPIIPDILQFCTDSTELTRDKEKQVVDCWAVILERLSFSQDLFDDDEICDTFKIAISGKSTKMYSITVKFWELKVIDALDTESLMDDFIEVLEVMYKREGFKIPWTDEQNISVEENMTLNVSSSSFASEESNVSAEESVIEEQNGDKINSEEDHKKNIDCDVIDNKVDTVDNDVEEEVIVLDDEVISIEDDMSSDDVIMDEEETNDDITIESDDVTSPSSSKPAKGRIAKMKDVIVLDSESEAGEEEEKPPTRSNRRISARISARLSSVTSARSCATKQVTAKPQKVVSSSAKNNATNQQKEKNGIDERKSSKNSKKNQGLMKSPLEENEVPNNDGEKNKKLAKSLEGLQKKEKGLKGDGMIEIIDTDEDDDRSYHEIDSYEEEDSCNLTNDSNYVKTDEEVTSDDEEFQSAEDTSMVTDCDVTKNDESINVSVVDLNETENSADLDATTAEKSIYEMVEMANMSIMPPSQPTSDQESESDIDKSVNTTHDEDNQNESVFEQEKSIYEVVEMANMSVLPPSQPASDQESESDIDKSVNTTQDESVFEQEKSIYEVVEMANMSVLPPSQPASDQESESDIDKSVNTTQDESVFEQEKSIYEVVEMANMSVLPQSQPSSDVELENDGNKSVNDHEKSVNVDEKSIYEVVEMANISILPSTLNQNNSDDDDEANDGIKSNTIQTCDTVENIADDDILEMKSERKSSRIKSKSSKNKKNRNEEKSKKNNEASLNRTFEEEYGEDLGVQRLDESFETDPEPTVKQARNRKQTFTVESDIILQKAEAVVNDDVIVSSQDSNSSKGGTPLRKSLRKRAPTPKVLRNFSYGSDRKTRKPKHLDMIDENQKKTGINDSEKSDSDNLVAGKNADEILESVAMETEIPASESDENLEKSDDKKSGGGKENQLNTVEEKEEVFVNDMGEKLPDKNIEDCKENLDVDKNSILPSENSLNNATKDTKDVPSVLVTSTNLNVEPLDPKETPKSTNRLTTIREECGAANSPGILKRRISQVLSPATNKSRRVSFAEPISLAQKEVIQSSPNTSPVDWHKRRSPHRVVSRRLSLPVAKRSVGGARPDLTRSPMSVRSAKIAAAIADIKARNNDSTKATNSTTLNAFDESPSKKSRSIPAEMTISDLSDSKYLQSLTLANLGQLAEDLFRLQHSVHTAIMKKSTG